MNSEQTQRKESEFTHVTGIDWHRLDWTSEKGTTVYGAPVSKDQPAFAQRGKVRFYIVEKPTELFPRAGIVYKITVRCVHPEHMLSVANQR